MSKPRHIYIIRHAQSMGNTDRTVYSHTPDWKVQITAKGYEQATTAGYDLAAAIGGEQLGVYISPYVRTRQTWEALNIPEAQTTFVKEDPRLVEQSWGNLRAYEPRTYAEIEAERDAYGPFYYRFLHGESGTEVYDRCTGFLETLYRDFAKPDYPDHILIVSHGFTLRVLLMRWLHWSVEHFHSLANPRNCARFDLLLDDSNHYQLTTPFPRESERCP